MPGCIPVIVGPTAGGKTTLAVLLAERIADQGRSAEIISADSVQIYRGMDIGSAKPGVEEMGGVPHHLVGVVEPEDRFTVHDWLAAAESALVEIRSRGAIPIVVGGTNLYIKAFLEGLFDGPEPDEDLRDELRAMTQAERRGELSRVDPAAASRIHPNDERRTVRALEVYRQTGVPISEHQKQWDNADRLRPGTRLFGLDWPTEALNPRINSRVKRMMERGLLDEVRTIAPRFGPQAREALGYKQLLAHLRGGSTLDEAVEQIKIETRRFAKNQRTWLKRLRRIPGSRWFLPHEEQPEKIARSMVDACALTG